jgi:hypothetical protein
LRSSWLIVTHRPNEYDDPTNHRPPEQEVENEDRDSTALPSSDDAGKKIERQQNRGKQDSSENLNDRQTIHRGSLHSESLRNYSLDFAQRSLSSY